MHGICGKTPAHLKHCFDVKNQGATNMHQAAFPCAEAYWKRNGNSEAMRRTLAQLMLFAGLAGAAAIALLVLYLIS